MDKNHFDKHVKNPTMATRSAYMSACFNRFKIFGFQVWLKPYGRNFKHGYLFVFQDYFHTCIKVSSKIISYG
ncbi:hypothetical protein HanRHA438_Chr05g0219651 [Helianthus annuus]|nr:hypothetical protein HanRHA438_Chr05g0219651 [Helianthus annuus]